MTRIRLVAAITTSFVVGAIAGAGSLWLVQENRPSSLEPTRRGPANATTFLDHPPRFG